MRTLVKEHESRSERVVKESRERIAAYMTRFWDSRLGEVKGNERLPLESRVEVNRLWSLTNTITSALYPTAARVAFMPDYSGKGDTSKAQAVMNDFLIRHAVQDQILSATTQTVIVGASGIKVAYEPGTARPTDRVHWEVIPAWDMVLDESCTNIGRERYRGVVLWMPKQEAEAKYGVKLIGQAKAQPSSSLSTGDTTESIGVAPTGQIDPYGQGPGAGGVSAATDGEWVRVLEFYNLVDPMRTPGGHTFLGRFEIWILDQGPLSNAPIRVEAMPFATTSGKPLAPLRPIIFASHPIYPYRHISVLERVMPQVRELNVFRALNAMQARLSATRILAMVEGAAEQDQTDAALSGQDMIVFKIKQDYKGSPKDALFAIDPPREDPAMRSHIAALQQEFTWATGQSPNSRGEVTEATKYEVQAANKFTEMELKRYATQLYTGLTESVMVTNRAFILAMQDVSDSTGGFSSDGATDTRDVADDVTVAPVGAVRSEAVVDAAVQDAGGDPVVAQSEGVVESEERAVVTPTVGPSQAKAPKTAAKIEPFPIRVDGEVSMVTKDDLDADFEVQFVDGVRTPMREDARKAAQLELLEVMQKLWAMAKKGDIFARVQMETIREANELPASWSPKALEEAERMAAERAATEKAEAKEEPADMTEAGAPEPEAAPASGGDIDPVALLTQAREQLVAGDLPGAARTLLPLAERAPQLKDMLDQAAASEDPQGAMLALVDQLLGTAPQPTEAQGEEAEPAEPAEVSAEPTEPTPLNEEA